MVGDFTSVEQTLFGRGLGDGQAGFMGLPHLRHGHQLFALFQNLEASMTSRAALTIQRRTRGACFFSFLIIRTASIGSIGSIMMLEMPWRLVLKKQVFVLQLFHGQLDFNFISIHHQSIQKTLFRVVGGPVGAILLDDSTPKHLWLPKTEWVYSTEETPCPPLLRQMMNSRH
jgi:hypothetical protein